MDAKELYEFMRGFTGTEAYYRITVVPINCTDGIVSVAKEVNAFWLFDAISSYQITHKHIPFQLWNLSVKGSTAVLTMQEDSNSKILIKQDIEYTDFPEGEWKFYLCSGVLMLPSEY